MKELLERLLVALPTMELEDGVRETIAQSTRKILADEALVKLAGTYYERMFDDALPMCSDIDEWSEPAADAVLGENMLFTVIELARAWELNRQARYAYNGIPVDFVREALRQLRAWIARYDCVGLGAPNRRTIYRYLKPRIFVLGRLAFEIIGHFFAYEVWREEGGRSVPVIDAGVRFDEEGYPHTEGGFVTWREETETTLRGFTYLPDGRLDPTPVTLDKTRCKKMLGHGDTVISVHVPGDAKLTPEAADASFAYFTPFMSQYFPEIDYKAFVCSSWLLDTGLSRFVREGSNILRFQSRFTIGLAFRNGFSLFDNVFKVPKHCPVEELVPTNRFQREILDMVKAGGTLYSGRGYILKDELEKSEKTGIEYTAKNNPNAVVWSFWGHEPLSHLRRMGGESIFNLGEWAEDWFEHIHTEEMVKKLSETGVNLIYTHFFKGFGLQHEKREMEYTRRLCEYGKKYGIRVLGYCQLGSLYYETMFDEAADLEDWVAYDADGRHVCWCGEYYRWTPCFNSRSFIDYMKEVIRYGIEEVGLSGFHFDNSYNPACYCPRCTQAFRDYLTRTVPDPEKTMGIGSFRHVRIPNEDRGANAHDTLYIHWLRYKAELLAGVHEELFSWVKELTQGKGIVLHNPCFPRTTGLTFGRRGYEPSRQTKACDYVFAENSAFLRRENGRLVSQIMAFKFGQRFGYRVFDTCWPISEQGHHRLPESREEIARIMLQGMIFSGVCGANWTPRTLRDGHRNVLEDTELGAYLPELAAYYYKNYELYNRPAVNHVKLFYSDVNCMLSQDEGLRAVEKCADALADRGVPFSVVTWEDLDGLGEGQTIVVPQVRAVQTETAQALYAAAQRGAKLLFVEEFARFSEEGRERALSNALRHPETQQGCMVCTWDNWLEQLCILNAPWAVTADVPGIIQETTAGENGELLLHLLRADNETTAERVRLDFAGLRIGKVSCISPENTQIASFDDHSVTLTELRTAALLVICPQTTGK